MEILALLICSLVFLTMHLVLVQKERIHARLAVAFNFLYAAPAALFSLSAIFFAREYYFSFPELEIWRGFFFRPALYLDAKNAPLIFLMALVLPVAGYWLRASFENAAKSFHIASQVMVFGLTGVFLSDSLILFYFFWETALIGAYFWIGLFGKSQESEAPSRLKGPVGVLTRFFLFTLFGSFAMLVSIAALTAVNGNDMSLALIPVAVQSLSPELRLVSFAGFFTAFAVKMPLFGFHGWLRDTYVGAPPLARVYLSAVMSKMGAYGFFIIVCNAYHSLIAAAAPALQILCVAGVIYGALICLSRERLIDVFIYASLSHLCMIGLGLFSVSGPENGSSALSGTVFQMLNHGLIMTALLSLDARSSGEIYPVRSYPVRRRTAALLLLSILAGVSLPGMSNFAGEILILYAAFLTSPWLAFCASFGLLIGAAAVFRLFHRIFLKAPEEQIVESTKGDDLNLRETALGLFLAAVWIALGFYPMIVIGSIERAIYVFRMIP